MTSSANRTSDSPAIPSDLNPEQALGLVGLGLMQKLSREGNRRLKLVEESQEKVDLHALRERLELTALAIETGAPLTTAEVSHLMGARPGSGKIERGGLTARRISRNVWKLNRPEKDSSYCRN